MKQITEDYCNFEIAKLLKEKGFNADTEHNMWYVVEKFSTGCHWNSCTYKVGDVTREYDKKCCIAMPTLQMVLKWLREAHKIEISISYGFPFIDGKQVFKYYWCPVKVTEKGLEYPMDDPNTAEFCEEMANSYKEAVEEAILYVLKNLI